MVLCRLTMTTKCAKSVALRRRDSTPFTLKLRRDIMGAEQQSWLSVAIYFGLFLAIFYVFIIMPRKKQEKKHKEVLNNLARGDKVVTIGGIKGEIAKIKEDSVIVKINDNTEMEFVKSAIAYKPENK